MTRQPFESLRSIAGGALVGLGLHILSSNVENAARQLSHGLGTAGGERLGLLPSALLAVSQAAQAYAFDHRGFVLGLLPLLISLWPLILVVVGAILLRDVVIDKDKGREFPASKNYFQKYDTECRFSLPSFDV